MSNLQVPPAEWLAELFEFEWCAECGRGAAGHTAIPFMGNWFARCDHAPQFTGGALIINPGGEPDGPCEEETVCPSCEGSGGGPGDRFNPLGACGYCEGSGRATLPDAAAIRGTMAWLAARQTGESIR